MSELASTEVINDLVDIHRGLHVAMEHLISSRNYSEAERVLRQVDQRMARVINSVRPLR